MACEWEIDRSCYTVTLPALGDTPTADEQAAYDAALAKQNDAEDLAVHVLWALSGRQFGICDATARPCPPSWWALTPLSPLHDFRASGVPVFWGGTWVNLGCGCVGACRVEGPRVVHLPGPVAAPTEQNPLVVTIAGQVLADSEYQLEGDALYRRGGQRWPSQDLSKPLGEPGTWSVEYRRGLPLPPGVPRLAGALANEFINAACGDTDACRIPITVREMTGRGGSFNFDPSFFLDKGRTGLVEVDRWLASVNPSGLAERASVM
ncbi:MAG: hypothetical protein CMH38_03255 [Microbacterium sp.]|uniref:hypothetical protein n=1 Tax=Microbacterium sp. TaxID=51671 RepID=UPI000C4C585C|nr:hypothetical protein [Microbacterium sp.]MAY48857.1 hypothetical protein [Microbacterium sp.]MAY48938.1 hypothetical protein [Microbacterium sp.]MBS69414.1 hypothetical protein [Pseudomonas sp.]|tara:strand:- start:24666 stop:25457 length:792 start_codon:yes stop_codon:yes gene_type:complete